MNAVTTKKIKAFFTFFIALSCLTTIAQNDSLKKIQQEKQEQCTALKTWYDSGDNIVETVYDEQDVKWVDTGATGGYVCAKARINRVLKGNLVVNSYINININSPQKAAVWIPDERANYSNILGTRALVKIHKVNLQGAFTTDNASVYGTIGKIYRLEEIGFDMHGKMVDGKKTVYNSTETFYKILQECCGVDLSQKKSPIKSNLYSKRLNNLIQVNKVTGCSELFISEYLDGQGSDNAVEIYNPTDTAINLSGYKLLIYNNASLTPTSIVLTGTISAFGTYVVAERGANSYIIAHSNQMSSSLNFNGDVCTVLSKSGIHIDKIGEIGVANPSGSWTLTPTGGTNSTDIRRKYNVTAGDTSWANCKAEWDVFSQDSTHNLGHHLNLCSTLPDPNIYFSIWNSNLSGGYLTFDVKVHTDASFPTYYLFAPILFKYDTLVFGQNVVLNNNITITNGSAFAGTNYQTANSNLSDEASNVFHAAINADLSLHPQINLVSLSSSDILLMTVKMKVRECYNRQTVQFIYFDSTASSTTYFTSNSFDINTQNYLVWDNIYVGGNSTTSDSTATSACYSAVIGYLNSNYAYGGEADAPVNPSSLSKLEIWGYNFGIQRPTVYMTAADDNYPHHKYIRLDNYDVASWNDSVITVNVPSDLFQSNPSFPNLAGTGNICVKSYYSTDSSFSPYPVVVPYSVLNGLGTNFKKRMGFSYRKVTDSTGTHDTAAYWFRFDPITVGTTYPKSRPLIKEAIQDWACELSIRYRVGLDTNIVGGEVLNDGISYVSFNNNMSQSGFVAQTRSYPLYCGATSEFYSSEADVSFLVSPPTYPWFFVGVDSANGGDSTNLINTDFFSVALHELGHASLLKHVNDITDVMYYTTFRGYPRDIISNYARLGGLDNVAYSKTKPYSSYTGCSFAPITIPPNGSSFCTSPTTGIKQINDIGENTFQLSVYPNPANQVLNVTFIKTKISSNTVRLTNMLGQTVYYTKIAKNEGANEVIDISNLAKGIYMLTVTDDANTVTKKIIVE